MGGDSGPPTSSRQGGWSRAGGKGKRQCWKSCVKDILQAVNDGSILKNCVCDTHCVNGRDCGKMVSLGAVEHALLWSLNVSPATSLETDADWATVTKITLLIAVGSKPHCKVSVASRGETSLG